MPTEPTIEFISYEGVSRKPRPVSPRLIIVHATRGPALPSEQYQATINWFAHPNAEETEKRRRNRWGPMADFVVGADGRIAQFGDYNATRSNWSAGYGAATEDTVGADEYGIAIEVAQSAQLEPFTVQAIDSLVWLSKRLCKEFSILAQRVTYWDQVHNKPIPNGFIGHEDLANGRKLGNSDPGPMFPWDEFIRRVGGEPDRRQGEAWRAGWVAGGRAALERVVRDVGMFLTPPAPEPPAEYRR